MAESTEFSLPPQPDADATPTSPTQLAPAEPPPRFRFKKIWLGPNGLRAGWAVLLFLAIVIGLSALFGLVLHLLHHKPSTAAEMTPGHTIFFELCAAAMVLIATKVMSLFDRKSWLDYGLRAPRRAAHFGQGLFWGVALMSAVMGVLVLTHAVTLEFSATGGIALLRSGLLWAVAFALVALNEELVCRGYAFLTLASGTNATIAAILMSSLFGLAHLHNLMENLPGILAAALFGVVLCLAVWRTASLWWVLGFHAAWDWSESFVYGAADSGEVASGHWLTTHAIGPAWLTGGSAGPEGSMVIFPALIVLTSVILLTLPRTATPWVRRAPQPA